MKLFGYAERSGAGFLDGTLFSGTVLMLLCYSMMLLMMLVLKSASEMPRMLSNWFEGDGRDSKRFRLKKENEPPCGSSRYGPHSSGPSSLEETAHTKVKPCMGSFDCTQFV